MKESYPGEPGVGGAVAVVSGIRTWRGQSAAWSHPAKRRHTTRWRRPLLRRQVLLVQSLQQASYRAQRRI